MIDLIKHPDLLYVSYSEISIVSLQTNILYSLCLSHIMVFPFLATLQWLFNDPLLQNEAYFTAINKKKHREGSFCDGGRQEAVRNVALIVVFTPVVGGNELPK